MRGKKSSLAVVALLGALALVGAGCAAPAPADTSTETESPTGGYRY